MTKIQFNALRVDDRLRILDSFVSTQSRAEDYRVDYEDIQLDNAGIDMVILWRDPRVAGNSYSPRTFEIKGDSKNGYRFQEI